MGLSQRYDFGTFIGAFGGLLLIVTAIMRGGNIDIFLSMSSLKIVMGGSLGTTFIDFQKLYHISVTKYMTIRLFSVTV